MNTFDYILLAVALGIDCMTVSFICGIIQREIDWKQLSLMAFLFGFFQSGMTLLGWGISLTFISFLSVYGKYCAALILLILGIKTLWEGIKESEVRIFNPHSIKTLLILSVATSIDALTVGFSFTCLGISSLSSLLFPVYIIGAMALLMSIVGKTAGVLIGKSIKTTHSAILAGLIFVLISIKMMLI